MLHEKLKSLEVAVYENWLCLEENIAELACPSFITGIERDRHV